MYLEASLVNRLKSHCRSGSAVKRSQDLAFGSPLGSQPRKRGVPPRGQCGEAESGPGSGPSQAPAQRGGRKRRALLDILEKASPVNKAIGNSCVVHVFMRWPRNGLFCAWQRQVGSELLPKSLKSDPRSQGSSKPRIK